ncbi:uncharacterized protein LOC143193240 [Rhynchophorus ferrugineus]|uniref:uncharacterized protein LOC143193240 n=1 Tax=Rhynchophorus ferrugineus TaxID=354439 RepID=UPI003FCDC806
MPVDCSWFGRLCSGQLCNLKLVAYISGCIGLVWRIVVMGLLSSSISTFNSDLKFVLVILGLALAYILISIIIDGLLLWGVFKDNRHFILPHIIAVGLEMCLGVIIISGVIMVLFAIQSIGSAFLALFVTIFCIGISFLLWLFNILHYKSLEEQDWDSSAGKRHLPLTESRPPMSW